MSARLHTGSACFVALLVTAVPLCTADIIHLANGGSIAAEAWEESGGNLIIRQGDATIVIPGNEVTRIEITPAADRPALAADPDDAPDDATPTVRTDSTQRPQAPASRAAPSLEEARQLIADIKRRIRDFPMAREETTRQLVQLLNYLGEREFRKRRYDEATTWFRESLNHDSRDADAQLGLAAAYFALGQDLYARSILERALVDHPDDPRLLTLLGDVFNSQERPEDALEVWNKAQSVRPDDAVLKRITRLTRHNAVDGAYRRSDAAHFTLKYDGDRAGPDLEHEILQFLEDQFPGLVNRFDHYPSQPIVVIVYPKRQFHDATQAEKNVAGLFDGKIRVPGGGLKRLNETARRVLLHELAHAFIAGKSRRTAPRWLHEGIAQMIEGQTTPRAVSADLARQFQSGGGADGWGRSFSYPSSLSFVEFLIEREGFYRLIEVLELMAGGTETADAFEEVTRYSLDELWQAWGEVLVREHLP